jgi:hypothetical protein
LALADPNDLMRRILSKAPDQVLELRGEVLMDQQQLHAGTPLATK